MKQILVTGGLGFIGSSLVEQLKKTDCKIDIVDNLSNNCVDPRQLENGKINKVYTCSVEKFSMTDMMRFII